MCVASMSASFFAVSLISALFKYVRNPYEFCFNSWHQCSVFSSYTSGFFHPTVSLALFASGHIGFWRFVVFVVERPNPVPGVLGFHEIWHVLVVVAATLHYLLMYLYVLPA